MAFSILRNVKKLMNFDACQNDLKCLHGIRVMSITWVILGHNFSEIFVITGIFIYGYES